MIPTWLAKDPGEKIKFLDNAINENDQGNAAAYGSKYAFQAEAAQKNSQKEQK